MSLSRVIGIDGLEGCGKSSVIADLAAAHELGGVVTTRVFGGGTQPMVRGAPLGSTLYEAALDAAHALDEPSRQLALALGARLHYRLRLPNLRAESGLVISDRSALSVLAYSFAVGPDAYEMARWALQDLQLEDSVIILDITPELSVARRTRKAMPVMNDVTLQRNEGFQAQVREGYRRAADTMGIATTTVDGSQPRHVVTAAVKRAVLSAGQ